MLCQTISPLVTETLNITRNILLQLKVQRTDSKKVKNKTYKKKQKNLTHTELNEHLCLTVLVQVRMLLHTYLCAQLTHQLLLLGKII